MKPKKITPQMNFEIWKTLIIYAAIVYPIGILNLTLLWHFNYHTVFWIFLVALSIGWLGCIIKLTKLGLKLGI